MHLKSALKRLHPVFGTRVRRERRGRDITDARIRLSNPLDRQTESNPAVFASGASA
jgi:hypothetical protein